MNRETLEGCVVLLVDDEELFRMTLAEALGARFPGVVVREASSGAEALAVLAAEDVDCVVTDLSMREIDGIELLCRMLVERSAVPVIVVSAFGVPARPDEHGFVCFAKPVELYSLCSTIVDVALGVASQRSRVTLAGLVQLLACQPRACAVRLEDGRGATAELRFDGGALVGAEARSSTRGEVLSGMAGALEALSWSAPRVTRDRRAPSRSAAESAPVTLENLFAHWHARARRPTQP